MSNPFDQNPWNNANDHSSGPLYGNAYEQNEPPFGNAYEQQQQPQQFSATGYNNAWGRTESNKTEYTAPSPQQPSAYQFTGTRYGNQSSSVAPEVEQGIELQPKNTEKAKLSAGPKPWTDQEVYHTPNKWRFWMRFLIFLTSIGHLGFAAGARPYSGQDIPFYTPACFYYLFAVAVLSIIWSGYHLFHYCYRRMTKRPKTNRAIMFAFDLIMAIMWGIGLIVSAVIFPCHDGGKFCAFYNVSLFWGFFTFALYIFSCVWDLYGACTSGRRRK